MTRQSERARASDGVRELLEWAARLQWHEVNQQVRYRSRLVLLDNLAAILSGALEPELVKIGLEGQKYSKIQESMAFPVRSQIDRYWAALINGIACSWHELDEGFRRAPCHAGLYCVPALLSEAEAEHHTVDEVLLALVTGYEVVARFALAWSLPKRALHSHAGFAAVGAAAAVGKLRELSVDQLSDLIAMASTLSLAGPSSHAIEGALVRNTWPGVGAWLGLQAGNWLSLGIGGLHTSVSDVYSGVLGAVYNDGQFTEGLGEEFAICDGYHKLYACCQYGHSAVEAALTLRAKEIERVNPDRITQITAFVHDRALDLNDPMPSTVLGAKFSLPHIIATALVLGTADASAFSSKQLHNPVIAKLRSRVCLQPLPMHHPPPHDRPARLVITLDDNTELVAECLSARGGPDRPIEVSELLNKWEDLTSRRFPLFLKVASELISEDFDDSQSWKSVLQGFILPARSNWCATD